MKKYTINGKTFDSLPGKLTRNGEDYSPVNEALFVRLGGVVSDDGKPTPAEKIAASFNACLAELEVQAETLELGITADDFKAAAGAMMSSELIAWAREKGVPEEMISAVRSRMLEFIADAGRIGMTWTELVNGVVEA